MQTAVDAWSTRNVPLILQIVDGLYAAACGEATWDAGLAKICRFGGLHGAALSTVGAVEPRQLLLASFGLGSRSDPGALHGAMAGRLRLVDSILRSTPGTVLRGRQIMSDPPTIPSGWTGSCRVKGCIAWACVIVGRDGRRVVCLEVHRRDVAALGPSRTGRSPAAVGTASGPRLAPRDHEPAAPVNVHSRHVFATLGGGRACCRSHRLAGGGAAACGVRADQGGGATGPSPRRRLDARERRAGVRGQADHHPITTAAGIREDRHRPPDGARGHAAEPRLRMPIASLETRPIDAGRRSFRGLSSGHLSEPTQRFLGAADLGRCQSDIGLSLAGGIRSVDPVRGVRMPRSRPARDRRLDPGEEEMVLAGCDAAGQAVCAVHCHLGTREGDAAGRKSSHSRPEAFAARSTTCTIPRPPAPARCRFRHVPCVFWTGCDPVACHGIVSGSRRPAKMVRFRPR